MTVPEITLQTSHARFGLTSLETCGGSCANGTATSPSARKAKHIAMLRERADAAIEARLAIFGWRADDAQNGDDQSHEPTSPRLGGRSSGSRVDGSTLHLRAIFMTSRSSGRVFQLSRGPLSCRPLWSSASRSEPEFQMTSLRSPKYANLRTSSPCTSLAQAT